MRRYLPIAVPLALIVALLAAAPASAHRPYFEEKDIVAAKPWQIKDPTVSTVVYATLQSASDVDYFAFDGRQGDRILLEITIPQIEGQENFAPSLALLGPGLADSALPAQVERPAGASGALLIEPPAGPATTFFEPFSRTSYWEQQSQRVTLPANGRYVVAVWHPASEMGRYGFVIGDKERPGGDLAFMSKLRRYWTPVQPASATPDAVPTSVLQDRWEKFWRFFGLR
jgi:hypothetical protein